MIQSDLTESLVGSLVGHTSQELGGGFTYFYFHPDPW